QFREGTDRVSRTLRIQRARHGGGPSAAESASHPGHPNRRALNRRRAGGVQKFPIMRPLYRFACFTVGAILLLIGSGGLVTSTNSGLAVPDWPNSYGYNMFA